MLDWSKPPEVKDGTLCFLTKGNIQVLIRFSGDGWSLVRCPICDDLITGWDDNTEFFTCKSVVKHYLREGEF